MRANQIYAINRQFTADNILYHKSMVSISSQFFFNSLPEAVMGVA